MHIRRPRFVPALLALLLALPAARARADLQIDITQGVSDPLPIAVVPFGHAALADGGYDLAAVVQHDLDGSGRFRTMDRRAMRTQPQRTMEVIAADWRLAGQDYVLVGRIGAPAGGSLPIDAELVNVLTGQSMGALHLEAGAATLRAAAHQVSDFVWQRLLGTRGVFATRIAYVAVEGAPPSRHYQLLVADADGEAPQVVLDSPQPIMSPAWSADGQWLAYVSFEDQFSAVYVQEVRTGRRQRVSARAGVNGAPAWSPDGKRLALTLSGSGGNLDLYVLDLGTQQLTRLTDDPAIDTEPAWSADGTQLYFTSDRAGGPQVYRTDAASRGRVQRITFGSAYNARPRVSPDGRTLAFVTREGSDYRIAVQDLASGAVRVLTHGSLDESPAFAPNGQGILYAGRMGGRAGLATVSVDGLVTQRLKAERGEVREPVWGPYNDMERKQ